jgi:glutathione S-transferase
VKPRSAWRPHSLCARNLPRCLPWVQKRTRSKDKACDRLDNPSGRLGDADWLDVAFSAQDLMMVSVLLSSKCSGIPDKHPNPVA